LLLFGYDALFLLVLFVLIIIGILVLALIVGTLIHWFPAVIVAIVVWFLTGSLLWAAVAFVVIAILMIAFRRR
jgi:hypothetical protein